MASRAALVLAPIFAVCWLVGDASSARVPDAVDGCLVASDVRRRGPTLSTWLAARPTSLGAALPGPPA
jgi:hypothetical protein